MPLSAKPDRALLWFFGGGYRTGSPAPERSLASRIADPLHAYALLPAYRLCPEHPLDASLQDALTAYRWLRDQVGSADRVIVGGVSAGGGLALRLLCALRDQGEKLPAAAVVISPSTDLAGTGASVRTNARSEAIFPPAVRNDPIGPYVLRLPEVAKRLGISRSTVHKMAKDGRLPAFTEQPAYRDQKPAVLVGIRALERWIDRG